MKTIFQKVEKEVDPNCWLFTFSSKKQAEILAKLKENQIIALTNQQKKQEISTQPIIDGFDGLMARVNALGELPWLPSFFIFLLFLAIETSPIFAKLLSPKGEYDYKLEDAETAVKTWVEQKVNERNILLKTDMAINNKIYNDINMKNYEYHLVYKKKPKGLLVQFAYYLFLIKDFGLIIKLLIFFLFNS